MSDGEQRPLLEQDAPAALDLAPRFGRELVEVLAEHLDAAGPLGNEAEDGPGEHRFALSGAADEAEDLAPVNVEIEPLQDQALAEADLDRADADHHLAVRVRDGSGSAGRA